MNLSLGTEREREREREPRETSKKNNNQQYASITVGCRIMGLLAPREIGGERREDRERRPAGRE